MKCYYQTKIFLVTYIFTWSCSERCKIRCRANLEILQGRLRLWASPWNTEIMTAKLYMGEEKNVPTCVLRWSSVYKLPRSDIWRCSTLVLIWKQLAVRHGSCPGTWEPVFTQHRWENSSQPWRVCSTGDPASSRTFLKLVGTHKSFCKGKVGGGGALTGRTTHKKDTKTYNISTLTLISFFFFKTWI